MSRLACDAVNWLTMSSAVWLYVFRMLTSTPACRGNIIFSLEYCSPCGRSWYCSPNSLLTDSLYMLLDVEEMILKNCRVYRDFFF